ncbi:hypothetical protein VTN31DRAFT_815 [Thermomyces dupontii]|uniref:uncharacterized protein n=1 Tax=Talaromyces thermophilus TaxID=28565 RepID=UPI003744059B
MCINVVQQISYCGHVCVERCEWSYITKMICPERIRKTQLSCMVGYCDVCMERAAANVLIVGRVKAQGETESTESHNRDEMEREKRRKREQKEKRREEMRDREAALAWLKKAIDKMSKTVNEIFERRKAEKRLRRSARLKAKVKGKAKASTRF